MALGVAWLWNIKETHKNSTWSLQYSVKLHDISSKCASNHGRLVLMMWWEVNIDGIPTDCCNIISWAHFAHPQWVPETMVIYFVTVKHRENSCFVLRTVIWLINATLITGKKHWSREFIYLSISLTTWPLHRFKKHTFQPLKAVAAKLMWSLCMGEWKHVEQ